MARSLQELAILNMRVCDIASPNLLFEKYPRNCHMISDIIFQQAKNLFIEELIDRDGFVGELWNDANGHFCQINDRDSGDACWCACNPNDRQCRCGCFHVFYMLIDRIFEEQGALNYNAKLKHVLARPRF